MPTQTEYKMAALGTSVEDEPAIKLGKLNVFASEDILLFIDTKL